jgi:hypothetical protein
MKHGCLIYAHDSEIDYGSQAVLAAKLAIKNLKVPVSLVTDKTTLENLKGKFSVLPFDHIIEVDKPLNNNRRSLAGTSIEFINANRSSAWDLTPYDKTLIIDTDFLIFSDVLNKYWNSQYDFLITPGMNEILENKNLTEYQINPYTINMLWATNIMFAKTPETRILFDLVEHIKSEYQYYAGLYQFNPYQYRNDYAFSVACHIMSAHGLEKWHGELPIPLLFKDTDKIINVAQNGQLTFLLEHPDTYYVARSLDQDIHVMNKYSLLDNLDQLMELAND